MIVWLAINILRVAPGLLRFARNDEWSRHCEERSDEAIQGPPAPTVIQNAAIML